MKHANGTIGRIAIQCVNPETQETGSFLYTGPSHRDKGAIVSPVFGGVLELYQWTRANGWHTQAGRDWYEYRAP